MNRLTETVKTLLNAMAFANAGNISEFHALLEASEQPAQAIQRKEPATSQAGFGPLPFPHMHQAA